MASFNWVPRPAEAPAEAAPETSAYSEDACFRWADPGELRGQRPYEPVLSEDSGLSLATVTAVIGIVALAAIAAAAIG